MVLSKHFQEILKDIGIKNSEETIPFLFPEISHLNDPFLLSSMEKACGIIKKAISNKEKVFIYADGDMDGIAGAAILSNFFKMTGISFDVKLTHRLEDYEIDETLIENILKMGYSLLFIIDAGTNSSKALHYCEFNSLTTIIIDHHVFNQKYKFSHVNFINPCIDETHFYGDMPASGLTLKLIHALKIYLPFFPEECFISSIELANLGILNDYAPLKGENRIIVKLGLRFLENTNILGLRLFQEYFYFPRKMDEVETITFFFNPKLNAPGRFGKPEISFKLLTSNSPDECENALKEIETLSKKKQKILKDIISKKKDKIYTSDYAFSILHDIPVSFSGMIASREAAKYQKPSFVGIVSDNVIQGSARGFNMINLHDFFSREQNIFLSFGGHKNAVGFKFKKENVDKIKKLWDSMELKEKNIAKKNKIYDMPIEKLEIDFIKEFQLLKPFGEGHPEIFLRSNPVKITKIVRKEKERWITWIKQSNFLFEAHFPDSQPLPDSEVSIIYSPKIKKLHNDLFFIWLDIKDFTATST